MGRERASLAARSRLSPRAERHSRARTLDAVRSTQWLGSFRARAGNTLRARATTKRCARTARETQRLWSGSCRSAAVSMLDAFRHVFKVLAAPQSGRTLANQVRLERLPKAMACCPIYEDM